MELHVVVAAGQRICVCAFNHRRSHVDTNRSALWTNHLGGQEYVKAATGAKIDDDFAGPDVCRSGGIPTRKAHVGLGWNRLQLLRSVTKRFCNGLHASMIC